MSQIAPLIRDHCLVCHDAGKAKGELRLSTFAGLKKGGKRGAIIEPGKPDESTLYLLVAEMEEPRMPPKEAGDKLAPDQIALLKKWIAQGARFDGASPEADWVAELRKRWQPPAPPATYAHPTVVRAMTFTPDAKQLIVGGYHELLIWDWREKQLHVRLRTRAERTNAMRFLSDGQTLAVAGGRPGQEGDVRLYRIAREFPSNQVERIDAVGSKSEAMIQELVQIGDEMLCLALSPDGKQLAAGGTDRLIRVWNLESRAQPSQVIENHSDWVLSLDYSADSKQLISGSRDRTAKIWNLAEKKSELTFSEHQAAVLSVAVLADGSAYSGSEDGQVRLIAPPPSGRQQRRPLTTFRKPVTQLAFRPETSQLLAASADGTVRVLNVNNNNIVRQLNGAEWLYALAISPDGKYAATGAWNGEVRVWDVETGKVVSSFSAAPGLRK